MKCSVTNSHALTQSGVQIITNVWKTFLGHPTLAGAVVLPLTSPVPQTQYMIVIQSLLAQSVNRMSLHFLFFNLSRPPWESGVTTLIC